MRFGFGAPPEEAPSFDFSSARPEKPRSTPDQVVRVPDIKPEVRKAAPVPSGSVGNDITKPQVPIPTPAPRRPLLVSADTSTPDIPKVPQAKPDPIA